MLLFALDFSASQLSRANAESNTAEWLSTELPSLGTPTGLQCGALGQLVRLSLTKVAIDRPLTVSFYGKLKQHHESFKVILLISVWA